MCIYNLVLFFAFIMNSPSIYKVDEKSAKLDIILHLFTIYCK